MNKEKTAIKILGHPGRLISGSKSDYIRNNPTHLVIFNSNICTINEKIWFGDIDINLDKEELINLSQELNEDIYILYEMDGRFEFESKPLINNFAVKFTKEGEIILNEKTKKYYKYEI